MVRGTKHADRKRGRGDLRDTRGNTHLARATCMIGSAWWCRSKTQGFALRGARPPSLGDMFKRCAFISGLNWNSRCENPSQEPLRTPCYLEHKTNWAGGGCRTAGRDPAEPLTFTFWIYSTRSQSLSWSEPCLQGHQSGKSLLTLQGPARVQAETRRSGAHSSRPCHRVLSLGSLISSSGTLKAGARSFQVCPQEAPLTA